MFPDDWTVNLSIINVKVINSDNIPDLYMFLSAALVDGCTSKLIQCQYPEVPENKNHGKGVSFESHKQFNSEFNVSFFA